MGIYSNNTHITTESVEAPEAAQGYAGSVGEAKILAESFVNDRMLFEALITNDFREAALNESAPVEEIDAVMEAATGGFVEKIKAFFKNLWAKLKGLIDTFKKTLQNVLIRDNKKFVEATRAEVLKKDLGKMKFTWRKPKAAIEKVGSTEVIKDSYLDLFSSINSLDQEVIEQRARDINNDASKLTVLNTDLGIKAGELGEVDKTFFDAYFAEAAEQEGLSSSELSTIMETLIGSKKELKAIAELEKNTDKAMSKVISELDKVSAKVSALVPKGGSIDIDGKGERDMNKNEATKATKTISYLYARAQRDQYSATKKISLTQQLIKFNIKQSRAVYAKANTFNPKAVKENARLVEAAGDASDYEFELAFEA